MEINYFESIPNTNSGLLEMSKKGAKSWTAIWTSNQTQGRGYAANKWETEKGKNIALSLLIQCELAYNELIFFNQWVCNALADCVAHHSDSVFVKWPNDLIVADKKVSGVLIETHKLENELNIIIGIGLNVNQLHFEGHPKAGSLATQIGLEFDLDEILSDLLTGLKNSYFLIEEKNWQLISEKYHQRLYKRNQWNEYKSNDMVFKGKISGVDEFGRLLVELEDGTLKAFIHKEIEMIY